MLKRSLAVGMLLTAVCTASDGPTQREILDKYCVTCHNQRLKTGWVDGALYLEVHHPLDGTDPKDVEDLTALTRSIVAVTAQRRVIIDWDTAERAFQQADGAPTRISVDRWIAPATAAAR